MPNVVCEIKLKIHSRTFSLREPLAKSNRHWVYCRCRNAITDVWLNVALRQEIKFKFTKIFLRELKAPIVVRSGSQYSNKDSETC